jgi:hypothetical protein
MLGVVFQRFAKLRFFAGLSARIPYLAVIFTHWFQHQPHAALPETISVFPEFNSRL